MIHLPTTDLQSWIFVLCLALKHDYWILCVNSWRRCTRLHWQTEDRVWQWRLSKVWLAAAGNGPWWTHLFSVSRPSSAQGWFILQSLMHCLI